VADIEKLDGKSLDIVEQNIEELKKLFPSVFSEGKIQFNKLEELLGNYVVEDEDHYNFTWHGKRKAGRLAQTPSTGTLRPCKEESVDWDTTENIFIEGDNLEVLKLLQKSYHRRVKMIYIDPPYNTGGDFVYEDDFKDGMKRYLEITGQLDGDGKKMGTNSSAAGRYHTNWLNMMYPRLKLARNLLKDDGVIFISIDENEQENLKKLCHEIFGDENFIASIMRKRKKEISSDTKNVAIQGEYIVAYGKSASTSFLSEPLSEEYIAKSYKEPTAEFPDGKWRPVPITVSKGLSGGGYNYEVKNPNGKVHNRLWAYPQDGYKRLETEGRLYFGLDGNGIPQRVIYAHESKGQPTSNYWDDSPTNKEGKKEILSLFGDNVFDTPKPTKLINRLANLICDGNDIILDFFAGSSATAHAVLSCNKSGKSTHRFIMVQLPEKVGDKSAAHKAGYKNIAEISKERIRRAAKKIKDENPDYDGDLGFKVFKLDSSNIKRWDADFDTLEQDLVDAADYLVEGRSDKDVLYELCLKLGLDLSVKIEEETVAGEKLFVLGRGYLVVCLSNNVTMDVVNGIGDLKDKLAPEEGMRVVFKDDGFKDDVIKTNALQTLKRFGITDIKSL